MVKVTRQGMAKKDAVEAFGVSRTTVWKWCKRAKHRGRESFRDLPRKPKKGKITKKVEASIVALRTTFGWGTARIRQALINLPGFMRRKLRACVQGVCLSRTAINGVLKRFGLNGYGRRRRPGSFSGQKGRTSCGSWT